MGVNKMHWQVCEGPTRLPKETSGSHIARNSVKLWQSSVILVILYLGYLYLTGFMSAPSQLPCTRTYLGRQWIG